MRAERLPELLKTCYGMDGAAVEFLREGGSRTYRVDGTGKYLLKVIGSAFSDTARQSVSVMRDLEASGLPVPKTILTKQGEALAEAEEGGETFLLVLQEYIEGEEPDMEARAEEIGVLTSRLHSCMEQRPGELALRGRDFFIRRYLNFLRQKAYPRLAAYEKLGDALWKRVENLPCGNCHGDLHRGNLLETPEGKIFILDFDTVCRAPRMFDITVMCDLTDYFRLKPEDIALTKRVFGRFLAGYERILPLSDAEKRSFADWVAIRHFQLQATILEVYGADCIDERFIDAQLMWLEAWLRAAA
ncbi:MAG: phosphotransferase [Clostridia bacterium]|nr:phosphotransferase [Clostridia bacterium]